MCCNIKFCSNAFLFSSDSSQISNVILQFFQHSIKRISKTALCILRLAIYEMKYFDEIPVSVSINEAVELCKKYATNDDASFVNGILATVSKSL